MPQLNLTVNNDRTLASYSASKKDLLMIGFQRAVAAILEQTIDL
jgi:hypothetical protein